MGDQPCKTVFSSVFAALDRKEWASAIDTSSPQCKCQDSSVSDHSRGAIADDEYLIRLVIAPQHVDKKKKTVKNAVLSHAETCGMSVFRDDAPTDEIMSVAKELVDSARSKGNLEAGLFGVLRFRCRDARQYTPEEEEAPVYCVYDTAKSDKPSHGDAFQRVNGVDKNRHDIRRKGLFAVIGSTFVPNEDFREGAFMSLAPNI